MQAETTIVAVAIPTTWLNGIVSGQFFGQASVWPYYDIKLSMEHRVFTHVKIAREHNRIADCLANFRHIGDSIVC